MPFSEISDPNQLAVLRAVLNEICLAAGIEPESPESEGAAGLLIHLHRIGCHSADELKATFEGVARQAECADRTAHLLR